MNKQLILENLKLFGLDDIESNIYLRLLEHGPKSPLELSKELGLNRTRIYRYTEKLSQKKLLEDSTTSWGRRLKAANPENLSLISEQSRDVLKLQDEALQPLIKDLSNIPNFVDTEFEIKHYRGKEGLRQMFWNQLDAKKEILTFSYESKNEIVGKNFAEKVRLEQVKRKIKLFEIENVADRGNFWYTDVINWGKYYDSYSIPKETLEIKQITSIFNNTVSIMSPSQADPVGVEIINSLYANTQKQIFWEFWRIAKENKK